MKILYVINGLGTGGAERSLAEMLPLLDQSGISASVVCLYRRREGVEKEVQGREVVRFLPGRGLIPRVQALRRILQAERPDVIHSTIAESNLISGFAAWGGTSPVLASLVNTPYTAARLLDPNISAVRLGAARVVDGWVARHLIAHFHAITHAVKRSAVASLRIPAEEITVVERGRDAVRLGASSPGRRHRVRAALRLRDDDEALVTVGRQEYQKGQRYLLEAMHMLISKRPRVVLLVAGRTGRASDELVRLSRTAGFGDRVRFLGHQNNVPDVLAAADLFVFPSLWEGLGGAIIEAMALSLPIVATNLEAIREVVEEGRNATLVSPANPAELAAALDRLLDDRPRAIAFGMRSRQIFEERFTLERSVRRMVDLYRAVAAASRHLPEMSPSRLA